MGLADRDYMRRDKVQWDASHGATRLEARASRDPGSASYARGFLVAAVLCGVVGTGVWWLRSSGRGDAPVADAPDIARPIEVTELAPDLDTESPVLIGSVTRVIDGDGIEVSLSSGPVKVRFHSIDAPERDQPWGKEATAALARRVGGKEVALQVVEQDQYDRLVAVVQLGDENLNEWLVQQGHAWAFRRYMKDRQYCTWESNARSSGRGLWALPSNERVAPWEWRAVQRGDAMGYTDYSDETVANCVKAIGKRPAATTRTESVAPQALLTAPTRAVDVPRSGDCRIKGNIGGSGKIYHVPGTAAYVKTKIDESKGERWFCSEEEAQAAGWVRARS